MFVCIFPPFLYCLPIFTEQDERFFKNQGSLNNSSHLLLYSIPFLLMLYLSVGNKRSFLFDQTALALCLYRRVILCHNRHNLVVQDYAYFLQSLYYILLLLVMFPTILYLVTISPSVIFETLVPGRNMNNEQI